MTKLEQVSNYIAEYFGSNANFYAKQVSDGSYRKTAGVVNYELVKYMILNRQSIACYQRNVDHAINWICFDFDILKINIGTEAQSACENYLLQTAERFVDFLNEYAICHILEFSGNRGIHVWINFNSPIFPYVGFEVVKYLLEKSGISIDRTKIGLDLFPSSASQKSSYGKAVKIPLSRHTKSGFYSVLLSKIPPSFAAVSRDELDDNFITEQLVILQAHTEESITSIEQKIEFEFEASGTSDVGVDRVRKIMIKTETCDVIELLSHWLQIPLVASLAKDIANGTLPHARRQLLVGILGRVVNPNEEKVGQKALLEIFSRMPNYSAEKTKVALAKLVNLPFPSLEIVESLCNFTYDVRLDTTTLASLLIPNISLIDDGLFIVTGADLKVTSIAERNYLYQNDEVRCLRVIEEMSGIDFEKLEGQFERFISGHEPIELYRHKRKELNKDDPRELVTLSASARLFATWAIKHLTHIYEYESSPNSYGYKMNRNFASGHIFKPWLYQWVEFLHDIADVLNNELHAEHYIVKADIKSFYDSIPQDNLERMLLTGLNNEISAKLQTMQKHSSDRYKNIVHSLGKLTQACNAGRKGVPQGPAYARVLAELYLGQVDELMDGFLATGELLFYHRYVDDIFFVVASSSHAEIKLAELRTRLSLLGLTLNAEKTSITKIDNFEGEFNKYRAQAKYAIDAISRNIDNATPYETNMALLEYNKLISQQDDNDDAVFLFSHLPGFTVADRYRDTTVNTIIKNGVGRGNLFKHVFIYLLNSPELWAGFSAIEKLTELQSEVFTSVCVDILSDQREAGPGLVLFIETQLQKLAATSLVNEHKVYLQLYFNVGPGITTFTAPEILRCIQIAENPDRFMVDEEIVNLTASTLNGIIDIGEFVSYLYPMCVQAETNQGALTAMAKIFSAKISNDEKNGRLRIGKCGQVILQKSSANEFYQLLCLFTLSTAISDRVLLERVWEFCATVFNHFDGLSNRDRKSSWYRNFDHIDVNHAHLNLAVSCITEGAIWRGEPDKYGIYANFHNALMVLVLTGEKNQTMDEVRAAIGKVKNIGAFYEWLFSENVDLFPSRKWFIENLTKNDCILLKREDQVLIRKRVEAFITCEATADLLSKTLTGYADYVVPYLLSAHTSILEVIAPGRTFFTNLRAIKILAIQYSADASPAPNLFSPKSMLTKDGRLPFNDEIRGAPFLIYEQNDKVEISKNNFPNFFHNLFLLLESDSTQAFSSVNSTMTLWFFYSRYIRNLDAQKEVPDFLRRLDVLFEGIEQDCDEVIFDLTVSSALYALYPPSEAIQPYSRVKNFFDKYNKIHRSYVSKHIFMVAAASTATKENLTTFFDGILAPLDAVNEYRLDLPFGLSRDIREYSSSIVEMIMEISPELVLSDFTKCSVTQSIVTEKISVNGNAYSYENVFVVNPASGLNQSFSSDHVFLLQSSEDTFHYLLEEKVFLFFMPKELTVFFTNILDRQKYYFPPNGNAPPYYPYIKLDATIDKLDINDACTVISVHRGISTDDARQRIKSWLRYIPAKLRHPMILLIEAHETMHPAELEKFRDHFIDIRTKSKNPIIFKRFQDFGGVHRILAANAEIARSLDHCGPDSLPAEATEASIFADVGLSGGQITNALDYYLSVEEITLDKIYFCSSDAARRKVGYALRNLTSVKLCFVLFTEECVDKVKACFIRHGLSPSIEVSCGRNISTTAFLGSTQKLSVRAKFEVVSFLLNADIMDHLMKTVFSTNKATRRFQMGKLSVHESVNLVARYHSMPKKALDFLFADLLGLPGTALFERVREIGEIK
jgi:hypothetical protein